MKSYKLSFGVIKIIKADLAEVIVNDGEVMDIVKVDEFHDFLLSNLDAPFSLLINKKHSYSYDFNAQRIIGQLDALEKIAVWITDAGGLMSTETLIDLNASSKWNIRIFREKNDALGWLLVREKEMS